MSLGNLSFGVKATRSSQFVFHLRVLRVAGQLVFLGECCVLLGNSSLFFITFYAF